MRAVVQRVTRASVTVDKEIVGEIGKGLVILLGVARDDTRQDAEYMSEKIMALRLFEDENGRMNFSVKDIRGALLVVSQFTICGDVRRGLRPSWSGAASPAAAEPLYRFFVAETSKDLTVATGSFQRMMQLQMINDGPVTILIDSRKLF